MEELSIVRIDNCPNGTELLEDFLGEIKNGAKHFRYYSTRPTSIIKQHLYTILLFKAQRPIAYGHLDPEGQRVWLGIAVADVHVGKGYGSKIMNALIEHAQQNSITKISLSVDSHNDKATRLYQSYGFELTTRDSSVLFFELPIR